MKEQVCTKCNVKKPKTDFAVDRRAKSGITTRCKACMKAYKKQRRKQEIVAFDFFE